MRVTYIGTQGDDTEVITHRGIEFHKGKAVEVNDKHLYAEDFANNPTFEVAPSHAHPKPGAKA